jgi:hypothetical protein
MAFPAERIEQAPRVIIDIRGRFALDPMHRHPLNRDIEA